jgi:hypothetical protein
MKGKDLTTLALMGLTSGLMMSCQGENGTKDAPETKLQQTQMSPDEQAFYRQLNAWGKKNFERMNSEQRLMVMKAAKAGCHGRNDCKGLGNCKTDKNSCAGNNDCKGEGGCAASPNKAVELVKKQMESKRSKM